MVICTIPWSPFAGMSETATSCNASSGDESQAGKKLPATWASVKSPTRSGRGLDPNAPGSYPVLVTFGEGASSQREHLGTGTIDESSAPASRCSCQPTAGISLAKAGGRHGWSGTSSVRWPLAAWSQMHLSALPRNCVPGMVSTET